MLKIKRVYEAAASGDGTRVLVDRVWPRGVSKAEADIVWWARDVAPSTELRKWFGHDPARWTGFQERYREELEGNAALQKLRELVAKGDVTLVYSAKDEEHNQARVLYDVLTA